MSLFPAYSQDKEEDDNTKKENLAGPSWLNYPCNALSEQKAISLSTSSESEKCHAQQDSKDDQKRKQKKKSLKKTKRQHSVSDNGSNKLFILDTEGNSGGNLVKQVKLTKPVYTGSRTSQPKKKRRKKSKRYFSGMNNKNEEMEDLQSSSSTLEVDEFLKRTEEFNKKLRLEPNNTSLWLEYVRLQDHGVGTKIGKSEKKLSILRRALEENGESEELLNEQMTIYETIYPFEKVSSEARSLLTKYPHNPVGWRWLIQATQCSLSKMTAPGVIQAYEHVLEGMHRIRHHNTPAFLDNILRCMMFLRQAGLWEQLWLLIELYLELTYTTAGSGAFKVNIEIPEQEIQSLEDTVLTSGLTLGALWLRIEHLRECVHFIPTIDSPDPQRTVFVDDLSGLLFPLGSGTYSRLMCLALVTLKVPPLPMTEAFYQYVGLKTIPWSLDSVEISLTANMVNKGIMNLDSRYLEACQELLIGPQYLNRGRIGAQEFLEGVDKLFNCCINNCAQEDVPSLLAWQVRWWSYIFQHSFNASQDLDLSKQFRTKAKALLKKHRQCLPLYTEYALYEAQVGNLEVSLKVFETALELQQPPLIAGRDRRDICALYKEYVELLLRNNFVTNRDKVIKVLTAMSFGEPIKNIVPNEDLTERALERLSHITTEIVREFKENDNMTEEITALRQVAIVSEPVSWLSCNAWFLYITKGVWKGCEVSRARWQTISSHVISTKSPLACVMLVFIFRTKLLSEQEQELITKENARQRIINFLNRLTKETFAERCPLIWRLALQSTSTLSMEEIKRTFFLAVEKCPWIKILYYEAAKMLPEDLAQIQDLLVEKELRLHITPEELEILREDFPEENKIISNDTVEEVKNLGANLPEGR
uniref:Protein NRDE2 homolog n=1 Tax=Rhodnius prolixus TaxID=13249 RepID=T1HR85_RHOPR